MKVIETIKRLFSKKIEFVSYPKTSDWMFDENLKVNWKLLDKCREFHALKDCKQSEKYHAEGNAWEHTKLVVENMYDYVSKHYSFNTPSDKATAKLLLTAALFHDIGKPTTTYFDKTDNDWHCKNHGAEGERITRNMLLDEQIDFREEVCWLVRHHMTLHYLDLKSTEEKTRKIDELYHGHSTIENLMALNVADCKGSISKENTDEILKKRVGYVKGIAGDRYSQHYLHVYDDTLPKAYIMIGVAGSGKDTYIKRNLPYLDCICRDDFREILTYQTVKGEKLYLDKQGEAKVTQMVNEAIKDACLNNKSFVVNQTSLNKRYRKALVEQIKDNNPNYVIIYIYLEPFGGVEVCKTRRAGQIKPDIIQRMWDNLEFPDYNECDELIKYKS